MEHEKRKSIFGWSNKRGVGKSVSSYNLAYSLVKLGKKVLAVDFDSQANMSTCFGVEDTATVPITIGHLMMNQIEDEEMPAPEEYIQTKMSMKNAMPNLRQGMKSQKLSMMTSPSR